MAPTITESKGIISCKKKFADEKVNFVGVLKKKNKWSGGASRVSGGACDGESQSQSSVHPGGNEEPREEMLNFHETVDK